MKKSEETGRNLPWPVLCRHLPGKALTKPQSAFQNSDRDSNLIPLE